MTIEYNGADMQSCWNRNGNAAVHDLQRSLDPTATTTHYHRGERIRVPPGAREAFGCIVQGAARLCVTQSIGQRRIIDFLLPGDLLEPAAYGQGFIVEASCDNTVMALHRFCRMGESADRNPSAWAELRDLSLATASRFRRQIMILGRIGATAKLCAFLLDMEKRLSAGNSDRIILPMSRYDIADYLAISVETVSRCITSLKARKAIAVMGRREFKILDRAAF